ncbi:uncharacterized protein LOC100837526 isoform X1 [Brachypodium distachyon]|nr:uncharacterized protein LOC100837526 isoform X1 [Brachypodium distachyon]|eukprot:XP_010227547.1 uncharacterized protein LOC100837526 isoform X1 [Brachypodium distachyon]
MRRSSSGARVSEGGDASSSSSTVGHHGDDTALPTFDPLSAAGRREAARVRELGRAVHCIPLLLLLCALVLWLSAAASPVLLGLVSQLLEEHWVVLQLLWEPVSSSNHQLV